MTGDTVVWLKDHARAPSATSRAAKRVSRSAVTPAAEDFSVINIADHHSAGTLSRCHHLETAGAPAPRSAAIASREGQSSMIDRNEAKSDMPKLLRPIVLKRKDNLSADVGIIRGHNVLMNDRTSIKEQFLARTAHARETARFSQEEMAEKLGIAQSLYSKYEIRTPLPHDLMLAFCALCDVTPGWMYTAIVPARVKVKRAPRKKKLAPATRKPRLA